MAVGLIFGMEAAGWPSTTLKQYYAHPAVEGPFRGHR